MKSWKTVRDAEGNIVSRTVVETDEKGSKTRTETDENGKTTVTKDDGEFWDPDIIYGDFGEDLDTMLKLSDVDMPTDAMTGLDGYVDRFDFM